MNLEAEAVDFGRGGAHIDEEGKERRVRGGVFVGVDFEGGKNRRR